MDWCYSVTGNYGLAIILFTFVSKIILLPVTIWTYFNSIKMIKIQPDINMLKIQYYGQGDIIAEKQAELQKKAGYHPLLSTIPLIIQLVLLMGVVEVIRNGIDAGLIDMTFGPVNLGWVPQKKGISLIWAPILAGLSSWVLCVSQNKSNILQAEQSNLNKYGTMAFSVGLSLYLGWFVFLGTALYWVFSNLFSVLQLYIMNWIIRPRRFVDYDKLEESRSKLKEMQQTGGDKKKKFFSKDRKRERADYKRFFKVVNKHLVFYSESNGFYKYYSGIINYILNHTNITIHYITSDPDDAVFKKAEENPRIRAYYIGENRLITLMMKMDADMVVMTMPDIENYHIKRSYVRKDIEYVYIPHGMDSLNLTLRKGSVDHYDSVLVSGRYMEEEIRKTEKLYGLPEKKLVRMGYPLLDEMRRDYNRTKKESGGVKTILIAPSWQKDNIIDSCLEDILDSLKGHGWKITVRPHPQHVRHRKDYMDSLEKKYEDAEDIAIQTDFSSNDTVFNADLLITDWSGIGYEFAYTTYKPVLFIDTPMKVMNPDYKDIDIEPINVWSRNIIGKSIKPECIRENLVSYVEELFADKDNYRSDIEKLTYDSVYNVDGSAEVGGRYIATRIAEISRRRKEEKNEEST